MGRILRAWRGSAAPRGKPISIVERIGLFIKALWTGKAAAVSSSGMGGRGGRIKASGGGKVGGIKAQGRLDKHLGKAYKRGNANFRIQKVRGVAGVDGWTVGCRIDLLGTPGRVSHNTYPQSIGRSCGTGWRTQWRTSRWRWATICACGS